MTGQKHILHTGLIGSRIQGSRSPAMHMTEARALGLDLVYEMFDLERIAGGVDALPQVLANVQAQGYLGVNITYPVKQSVISLLDDISDDARAMGACNTVVLRDGRRSGHNTDWFGFAESFRRGLPDAALGRVVLLGAGGAGSAVAYALLKLGARRVAIHEVDQARSRGFISRFNALAGEDIFFAATTIEQDVADADGIINCTPVGMNKAPGTPLPVGLLQARQWVADVVYVPLRTEFLRLAAAKGCRTLEGGGMAVFQAGEAFRLFTGREPNYERMLAQFQRDAMAERLGRVTFKKIVAAGRKGYIRAIPGARMRRSIATISLSGTLEDKLEAVAASGFDAVQIFDSDILYYEGTPASVREMAQSLGLAIDGFQSLRDFEGLDDSAFRKGLERAERKLDLMAEMGAPLLLVPANTLVGASADKGRVMAQLRALAESAGRRNIRLAYGPLAWATHVRTLAAAWDIVQAVDHPQLDIFVSSFHALAAASGDPATVSKIPGARIATVQLADAPNVTIDPISKSRFYSCLPGEGDLDLPGFVRDLLRTGYAGSLTLNVMNDAFRGAPPRITAEDGMRSLKFLEENVRRALEKSGSAEPGKVVLFDPPAPAKISGLEFLEFAASGADADALGGWFESFGFRNMGKHRSKNVFLYRNGKVNFALNAEPQSFAQSYYFMHGPSVCAIGIRADDDRRALDRAIAFTAQRFEGRIGPNELSIPAVRAQDGSLIYFVGEADARHLYEIEFAMEAQQSAPGTDLQTVDHLALSLPPGEMDSRVLFYRAVLGFDADATWVLPDPNGLVKSRAVTSKGHAVRIPLNVSLSRRTATSRQVDTQAGAGVHHVAFSCADIFATVTALRQSGASLLDIPANYYDDLAMRFDLKEAFITRLKAAHILYDRIGDGEFLHVYSEPFQGRFFFEFVQRIGGYDQYGAANAPFRMAAFARLQRERDRELTL